MHILIDATICNSVFSRDKREFETIPATLINMGVLWGSLCKAFRWNGRQEK